MTVGAQGTIHEVTVEMRQEGQQVMNVMHFECATEVDNLELRLLRALLECYLEVLIPVSGSNLQMVAVRGKQVNPDLGPIYEINPEATDVIQGEAAGDTLPTHLSICANIHTTRGGRSGRGRIFLPGIPEGASQGSFIPTGNPYWTAVLAFLACVAGKFIRQSDPPANNWVQLGVVSRKLGNPKPPYTDAQFARATRLTIKNRIGSSNSRKVGRGS